MDQNSSLLCSADHGAQLFNMVRIGEAGGSSGVASVENVRSVLSLSEVGGFENRWKNGGSGGAGIQDDISCCFNESGRRNVLWMERSG